MVTSNILICFKFKTLKKVVPPSVASLDYSEMIDLAQLRWFGRVVRMEMRGTPKWPGKLEHGKKPRGRP